MNTSEVRSTKARAIRTASSANRGRGRTSRHSGFTLVELLVVIAIIAVLVSILAPSIGHLKGYLDRFVCSWGMHQLGIAWVTYATDNDGLLVGGGTGHVGRWYDWVKPWGNIEGGLLFPYVERPELYKCTTPVNATYPISYSIPGPMNGHLDWRYVPGNSGWPWVRLNTVPGPERTLLIVEEDDWRGYNMGSWLLASENQWIDYASGNHQGGDNVAFADGHVIYRHWEHPNTLKLPYHNYRFYMPDAGNPDLAWLWEGYWPR